MQNSSKYSSILLMEAGGKPENDIVYFNEEGIKTTIKDLIVKIKKNDDKELVVLKSGLEIPIEKIYMVDFELSPYHSNDYFSCDCV